MLTTILVFLTVVLVSIGTCIALYLLNVGCLFAIAYTYDSSFNSRSTKIKYALLYLSVMFFGSWGIIKVSHYLNEFGHSLVGA